MYSVGGGRSKRLSPCTDTERCWGVKEARKGDETARNRLRMGSRVPLRPRESLPRPAMVRERPCRRQKEMEVERGNVSSYMWVVV